MFSRDGSPVEKTYPQRENQRLPVPRVGKFDPSSTATSLAVLLSRSSAITILDFLQGSFANVESATALEFVGRLVGDQFFSRIHKRHAYSTDTHTNFFLLGATCQSKSWVTNFILPASKNINILCQTM
jgi:hypothetical protein